MRQWLATGLLMVGAAGMLALWSGCRADAPALDDATVNRKVDARLHQVLSGLLATERLRHAGPAQAQLADARVRTH
jgi:hypothetical protein